MEVGWNQVQFSSAEFYSVFKQPQFTEVLYKFYKYKYKRQPPLTYAKINKNDAVPVLPARPREKPDRWRNYVLTAADGVTLPNGMTYVSGCCWRMTKVN